MALNLVQVRTQLHRHPVQSLLSMCPIRPNICSNPPPAYYKYFTALIFNYNTTYVSLVAIAVRLGHGNFHILYTYTSYFLFK